MKTKKLVIRCDPKTYWTYRHVLDPQTIRDFICPPDRCAYCRKKSPSPHTRNGWFCLPCADSLDQPSLPLDTIHTLREKVRKLEAENKSLRQQLQDSDSEP